MQIYSHFRMKNYLTKYHILVLVGGIIMKKTLFILFAVFLLSMFAVNAQINNSMNLTGEYTQNKYFLAEEIVSTGTFSNDFMAAGSTLSLDAGLIGEDANLLGQEVTIKNVIGGDLRVIASDLLIEADIFGDLVFVANTATIKSSSSVGGNTYLAVNTMDFSGTYEKDVQIVSSWTFFNATVKGNLNLSSDFVEFREGTLILGDVTLTDNLEIDESLVKGKITYVPKEDLTFLSFFSFGDIVLSAIALIVLGIVSLLIAKKYIRGTLVSAVHRPFISVIFGILGLILIPLIAGLLAITLVGFPLFILLLLAYFGLLIVCFAATAIYFGNIISRLLSVEMHKFAELVVGAVVMILLPFVPFIGGLLVFIAFLITFGAMLRNIFVRDVEPKKPKKKKQKTKRVSKKTAKKSKKKNTPKQDRRIELD